MSKRTENPVTEVSYKKFKKLDKKNSYRASRREGAMWSVRQVHKKCRKAPVLYVALLEIATEQGSLKFSLDRLELTNRTGIKRQQTISEALTVLSRDAHWMDKTILIHYVKNQDGKSSISKKSITLELLKFTPRENVRAIKTQSHVVEPSVGTTSNFSAYLLDTYQGGTFDEGVDIGCRLLRSRENAAAKVAIQRIEWLGEFMREANIMHPPSFLGLAIDDNFVTAAFCLTDKFVIDIGYHTVGTEVKPSTSVRTITYEDVTLEEFVLNNTVMSNCPNDTVKEFMIKTGLTTAGMVEAIMENSGRNFGTSTNV